MVCQLNSQQVMDSNNYNEVFTQLSHKFNTYCEEKDSFLEVSSQKWQQLSELTKSLFDLNKRLISEDITQKATKLSVKKSLNELFTDGFDDEQVWQQIQLQNRPILQKLVTHVANISAKQTSLTLNVYTTASDSPSIAPHNGVNEGDDDSFDANEELFSEESIDEEDDEEEDETKTKPSNAKPSKPMPKSVVDDVFFNLHEMHVFLDNEDLKEETKTSGNEELMSEESDEDIDYFNDLDDEEEEEDEEELNGREAMFNDFFDPPIGESVVKSVEEPNDEESDDESDDRSDGNDDNIDTRDVDMNELNLKDKTKDIDIALDESSSSDEENEPFYKSSEKQSNDLNEDKSEFERIQDSLNEKIAKQERLNLLTKSWQMSGEISSDKRPENSLLEEHLHFDHTSRPAPLITEETTFKLEDIIKQRIKDNSYDDVVRKVKPKEKPFEYRRRLTMDSEKSKQSLSQIYEKEFLRQQQNEKEENENSEHKEIKKSLRSLFVQLDALSSFHFTPRPVQPDIKIINNMPAITVEEVTPLATSEVSLLAPQEVFNNQKRELQTKSEKSKTDRKRDRRVKKSIQSKKFKHNESKEKATKKKTKDSNTSSEDVKHLSSSKAFFDKLQEKTTQVITKNKLQKNTSTKTHKKSNELKL